jgi:hypothetical protein
MRAASAPETPPPCVAEQECDHRRVRPLRYLAAYLFVLALLASLLHSAQFPGDWSVLASVERYNIPGRWLADYQTLISGVLAIAAALLGGRYLLQSARLPVEDAKAQRVAADRRRLAFTTGVLAHEFMRLATLARQADSTIRVTIAANTEVTDRTREKTTLRLPTILDEWEFMSLISSELFEETLRVRDAINRHNFDMARAGGSFGDSNFRRHVQSQAADLYTMLHHLANRYAVEGRDARSAGGPLLS